MARAAGKPKPPPYPRPVPDIYGDELAAQPVDAVSDDIQQAWVGAGTGFGQREDEDAETYAERRAAKRRRIEANAQAYLRGQQLYIMSAHLKGPLDKGWKNPWSGRARTEYAINRVLRANDEDGHVTPENQAEAVDHIQSKRKSVNAADKRWLHRKSASQEMEKQMMAPVTSDLNRSSIVGLVEAAKQNGRVKNWLKPNNASSVENGAVSTQSSPTPVGWPGKSIRVPRSLEDQSSDEEEASRHIISTTYERIQQLSRKMTKIMHAPKARTEKEEANYRDNRLSGVQVLSRVRDSEFPARQTPSHAAYPAEEHSLESRRATDSTAIHSITPGQKISTTKPDNAMDVYVHPTKPKYSISGQDSGSMASSEAGETARIHIEADEVGKVHQERDNTVIAQERLSDISTTKPVRDLEADESVIAVPDGTLTYTFGATSDLNTTDQLPSAQRVSNLQSSTSSGLLAVQMIEEECAPSGFDQSNDTSDIRQSNELKTYDTALEPSLTSDTVVASDGPVHGIVMNRILDDMSPTNGAEAFAGDKDSVMNAASAAEVNTITHPLKKRINPASHPSARKSSTRRKQQRASFPKNLYSLDPLQNSVKQMSRVKIAKSLGNPPAFSVSKDLKNPDSCDGDDNSIMADINGHQINAEDGTQKQRKGILKSANPTNSQNSNRQSKYTESASQLQEGQGDKFLEEVRRAVIDSDDDDDDDDEQEEFDLKAAIDELGSFLSSWDAEKEASGIIG